MADQNKLQHLNEQFAALVDVFDERTFGFSAAVVISGIPARQLRNGLDRGNLSVGEKLASVDRWVFSSRECLQLMIVNELATRAWVPVGQAATIAKVVAGSFQMWGTKVFHSFSEMTASEGPKTIYELVVFADDDKPQVLLHQRGGGDWGFYDLDGNKTDLNSFQRAHIRLPVAGLLSDFYQAHRLVDAETGGAAR